ncbi:MAG: hypothetical protein IPK76_03195 [Lewinellaceae bacterium]|nr:hypothetical protein [Lewinellaceae bacterium]
MKKVIFLLFFLAQSLFASAQLFVEGTELTLLNTSAYLEASPLRRTDGTYHFQIDYGQKPDSKTKPGECLTDNKARRFEFRSTVDGLNFLFEHGWEVVLTSDVGDMRRFLLKRR